MICNECDLLTFLKYLVVCVKTFCDTLRDNFVLMDSNFIFTNIVFLICRKKISAVFNKLSLVLIAFTSARLCYRLP